MLEIVKVDYSLNYSLPPVNAKFAEKVDRFFNESILVLLPGTVQSNSRFETRLAFAWLNFSPLAQPA